MGVTLLCQKSGHGIDMGYGGFWNLRSKVADLAGEPFASHYKGVRTAPFFGEARKKYFEAFDRKTEELIRDKKVLLKIVDFCLQPDAGGVIHYGACKEILKIIGSYDDNIMYGYCGRPDCAMFKDFKALLIKCVKNKCDLVWL